jgi:hypothetical protein
VSGVPSLLALAPGLFVPSLEKSQPPIKTIGEAFRQQDQALIEKLIGFVNVQLQQGLPKNDIFAYLLPSSRRLQ